MKTIGQLIKQFDNQPENTVAVFNVLFPNSPILLQASANVSDGNSCYQYFLQVHIGIPVSCMGLDSQIREITVGNETMLHTLTTHSPTTSELKYLKDEDDKKEEELYDYNYAQEIRGFD